MESGALDIKTGGVGVEKHALVMQRGVTSAKIDAVVVVVVVVAVVVVVIAEDGSVVRQIDAVALWDKTRSF